MYLSKDYHRRPSPSHSGRYEHHSDRHYGVRGHRGHPNRRDEMTRGGYRDRDREGYRSPGYSRSRSRSRSPRGQKAGQPAKELILDGLAADITEEDVGIYHPYTARLTSGSFVQRFGRSSLKTVG